MEQIQKYLSNDDTNILTYGDGLSDINVDKLLKFHHSHKKILTITGVRPPARFGEIIEDNRKVIHFQEKPHTSHPSNPPESDIPECRFDVKAPKRRKKADSFQVALRWVPFPRVGSVGDFLSNEMPP